MGLKIIIGIAANAPQSGKTTFMKTVEELVDYRVKHFAFATPLKRALAALINEATGESIESILVKLEQPEYKCSVLEPTSVFGKHTVREMMQLLGTEFGRDMVCEKMWVNMLLEKIQSSADSYDICVVDDMRMLNEYEALNSMNNLTTKTGIDSYVFLPVYVLRPRPENSKHETHRSEGAMDFLLRRPSCVIHNDGTLDEYKSKIKDYVNTMILPPLNNFYKDRETEWESASLEL